MTDYTAFAQVKITSGLCEDVLCTAFEGGIDYWIEGLSARRERRDNDFSGFAYVGGTITPADEDRGPMEITIDLVAAGIAKILEKGCAEKEVLILGPKRYGYLLGSVVDDDASMIDADIADVIVQVALFGEVVYG